MRDHAAEWILKRHETLQSDYLRLADANSEISAINAEALALLEEYTLTPPKARAEEAWHTEWYARVTSLLTKAKGEAA